MISKFQEIKEVSEDLDGMPESPISDREEIAEFLRDLFLWDSKRLAIESRKKWDQYILTGEGIYFAESYIMGNICMVAEKQRSSFFDNYRASNLEEVNLGFRDRISVSAPGLLQNYFINGKVFKLTEPVYDLLKNTSNRVFLREHPFYVFAIDQKIRTKYEGLNIILTIFYDVCNDLGESVGCNYLAIGRDERDDSEFWIKGEIQDKLKETGGLYFTKEEVLELHRKTKEMYCNFLDYLNHPHCRQTLQRLSYNNVSRVKRGKFPRQDKTTIDIKPGFISYGKINKKPTQREYSHSFWVRGHFRHFRHRDRYKRLYELTKEEKNGKNLFLNGEHISRWVLPYIKGIGRLKEKMRRMNEN